MSISSRRYLRLHKLKNDSVRSDQIEIHCNGSIKRTLLGKALEMSPEVSFMVSLTAISELFRGLYWGWDRCALSYLAF